MVTLKTAKEIKEVGSFVTEVRDLNEQKRENEEIRDIYLNQKVFKDKDITNISYYMGYLRDITSHG